MLHEASRVLKWTPSELPSLKKRVDKEVLSFSNSQILESIKNYLIWRTFWCNHWRGRENVANPTMLQGANIKQHLVTTLWI